MIDIEKFKPEIIKRLKPLNPYKIILFGSYANGSPNEDSDIDLYIVTNDNYFPKSYKENMEIRLKISNAITQLQKIIPIDTITHTKIMYEKFIKDDSYFCQEIINNGIKIYG